MVNFPLVHATSSQLEYMLFWGVHWGTGQLTSLVHPLCYRYIAVYIVGTQLGLADWTWWGHIAFLKTIRPKFNDKQTEATDEQRLFWLKISLLKSVKQKPWSQEMAFSNEKMAILFYSTDTYFLWYLSLNVNLYMCIYFITRLTSALKH